jgi:hypothetical protein
MSPPTGVAVRVDAGLRFFPITVACDEFEAFEVVTVFRKPGK